MTTYTFQKKGLVIRSADGRYWRDYTLVQEAEPWTNSIDKASLHDPRYCKKPTDVTYVRSPDQLYLERAKLLPVTVTTIYEVEE